MNQQDKQELAELYVISIELTRRVKNIMDRVGMAVDAGTAQVVNGSGPNLDEMTAEWLPQCDDCGEQFKLRRRRSDGNPFLGCSGWRSGGRGCSNTMKIEEYLSLYEQRGNAQQAAEPAEEVSASTIMGIDENQMQAAEEDAKKTVQANWTDEQKEEFYRQWRIDNGYATQEDLEQSNEENTQVVKSTTPVEQEPDSSQDGSSLSSQFRNSSLFG